MSDLAIQDVPLDQVVLRKQIRTLDEAAVRALEESIRTHGVIQPLLGFTSEEGPVLLEGHHRLEACRRLGMTSVPMIVGATELDALDVALRQAVLNSQRKNLSPIELARAIHTVMQVGEWSVAKAAAQVGTSPGNATRLLALLRLPESVQQLIRSDELSASVGYALSRLELSEQLEALAQQIVQEKWTRDQALTQLAQRRKTTKPRRCSGDVDDRVAIALDDGSMVTVAGPAIVALGDVAHRLEEALTQVRGALARGLNLTDLQTRPVLGPGEKHGTT